MVQNVISNNKNLRVRLFGNTHNIVNYSNLGYAKCMGTLIYPGNDLVRS